MRWAFRHRTQSNIEQMLVPAKRRAANTQDAASLRAGVVGFAQYGASSVEIITSFDARLRYGALPEEFRVQFTFFLIANYM